MVWLWIVNNSEREGKKKRESVCVCEKEEFLQARQIVAFLLITRRLR